MDKVTKRINDLESVAATLIRMMEDDGKHSDITDGMVYSALVLVEEALVILDAEEDQGGE